MNDKGCVHLNNFKAAKGSNPYKIVHAFFVSCTSFEARRYKVSCAANEVNCSRDIDIV